MQQPISVTPLVIKPPKVQQYNKKLGALKDYGGYPNPTLILAEVLKKQDWIVNNDLAIQSTITANQISRIRTGKVDDVKGSDIFKILVVLPHEMQLEFIHQIELLFEYYRELVSEYPYLRQDLLGDSPPEIGG